MSRPLFRRQVVTCLIALSGAACTVTARAGEPGDWRALSVAQLAGIRDAAVSRLDSNRVLAWSGILYRSTDGGDSWELVAARFEGFTAMPRLANLEFDSQQVEVAWATVGNQVFRTADFGDTWNRWGSGTPGETIASLVLDKTDPLTSSVGVVGGAGRGVHRTTDGGATWERRGASFVADVHSLSFSPTDPGVVLAGTTDGIARSTDDGVSWELVRAGGTATELRWAADGSVVRALQGGIVASTDAGATWSALPPPANRAKSYAFDPGDPIDVVAAFPEWQICWWSEWCSSWGYSGYTTGSTDGGDSWFERTTLTACRSNGSFESGRLTQSGGRTWAWLPNLGIARSEDLGLTWENLVDGMHEVATEDLEVSPTGAIFDARPYSGFDKYNQNEECVLRSTNEGLTWSVPNGCFHDVFLDLLAFQTNRRASGQALLVYNYGGCDIGAQPHAMRFSSDGDSLRARAKLAGSGIEADATIGFTHGSGDVAYIWLRDRWGRAFCKTEDGGESYDELPMPADLRPTSAVVTPESDATVFVTSAEGDPVRRSTDGGVTWESRSRRLPPRKPIALLMNPSDGGHLLVVFETGSPWQSRDGGLHWTVFRSSHTTPARASTAEEWPVTPDLELRDAVIHDADWDVGDDPPRVFLATDQGIWISNVGFQNAGLPLLSFHEIAYSATLDLLLAATERHGVFALDVPHLGGAPVPFAEAPRSRPPAELALGPSPFAETTWAEVRLDHPAFVGLKIYDAGGRRVRTLLRQRLSAGPHRVSWDGRDDTGRAVASGVYFFRFEEDGRAVTRHVVLMR